MPVADAKAKHLLLKAGGSPPLMDYPPAPL